MLRLSAGARGALEIESEGPRSATAQPWAQAIEPRARARRCAWPSSPPTGCPLCAQVAPAVEHVAADPLLAVRTFDEHADAPVWARRPCPGSPVRGRAERRRRRAGEGHVQQPRASSKACSRRRALASGGWRLPPELALCRRERGEQREHFADAVLRRSSRRGFLEWAGDGDHRAGRRARGRHAACCRTTPTRTRTSAATRTRRATARTRRVCRASTVTTYRCVRPTGIRSTTSGARSNAQGYPVDEHGQVLRDARRRAARAGAALEGLHGRRARAHGLDLQHGRLVVSLLRRARAPADGLLRLHGACASTATKRSSATATRAATCSACSTTKR